jgi:hypothetical protein
MKSTRIVYYISTGLVTALMLMSIGMYTLNNAEVSKLFESLGYPSYIVIPLAIAKALGLIAIWTGYSKKLREWAYAGFFFDFVLALAAHLAIGDGEFAPALVAIILLLTSYVTGSKLEESTAA